MTKFAPHNALQLIARSKLTSDERVVFHCVATLPLSSDAAFQEASAPYRAVELSSGSNVIPRRARPGLAGLRPHTPGALSIPEQQLCEPFLALRLRLGLVF